MPVTRNNELNEVHLTDLGVTLRTLLAVAAGGYEVSKRRTWTLIYKDAVIGKVRVATTGVGKYATTRPNAGSARKGSVNSTGNTYG